MASRTKYPTVTLDENEMAFAGSIGVARQTRNMLLGKKDAHGTSPDQQWEMHVRGALGEIVLAKHLGVLWNGDPGDPDAHDVAGYYQVRAAYNEKDSLLLHRKDEKKGDAPFVLVTGKGPSFGLRGWFLYREAKGVDRYRDDPSKRGGGPSRPCLSVPIDDLHEMSTLEEKPWGPCRSYSIHEEWLRVMPFLYRKSLPF